MLIKTLCMLTLSACLYLCWREYLTAVGELISISICPNSSDCHFRDEMSRWIFFDSVWIFPPAMDIAC